MQEGWVYVLVNSSMPGMAKVGRTFRLPSERVAELQSTGVATPFILAYEQAFADCCAAEKAVHDELDRRGLRVALNREFFRGPPSDIIRLVLETADQPAPHVRPAADGSAKMLLKAGDECFFGAGERLQDMAEAIRFYKLAVVRGSLIAYERLGQTYIGLYVARKDIGTRRRAMDLLREGARSKNYYCYAEMATLFAFERNVLNFRKAWELFFVTRKAEFDAEVEAETARFMRACCNYIAGSLVLGLQPECQYQLSSVLHDLINLLLIDLDEVRNDQEARFLIVACLRWICLSLPSDRLPKILHRKNVIRPSYQLLEPRDGLRPPGYGLPLASRQLAF